MQSEQKAVDILSKHGKSFRFAGHFLSKENLLLAARLYAFCRYVDDVADETTDKAQAATELTEIQKALESNIAANTVVQDFLDLKSYLGIDISLPLQLIEGVKSDLGPVAICSEAALIRYAYRVAGVVGLMMCPILGADSRGSIHAMNLGIAMQLTNIARDVYEDAVMGRRYIPNEWCSVTPQDILHNDGATQDKVIVAVKRLLKLSEAYYASGWLGLPYLPTRSRQAIAVAGSVYREIGVKLAQNNYQYWKGRTQVSFARKLSVAAKVLAIGPTSNCSQSAQFTMKALHASLPDPKP